MAGELQYNSDTGALLFIEATGALMAECCCDVTYPCMFCDEGTTPHSITVTVKTNITPCPTGAGDDCEGEAVPDPACLTDQAVVLTQLSEDYSCNYVGSYVCNEITWRYGVNLGAGTYLVQIWIDVSGNPNALTASGEQPSACNTLDVEGVENVFGLEDCCGEFNSWGYGGTVDIVAGP